MSSLYSVDKSELMRTVLTHLNVKYNTSKNGWQKLSCPNGTAHAGGDRNPSASVNLHLGKFTCFACNLSGDGFDLMLELERRDAKSVVASMIEGNGTVVKVAGQDEWW